MSKYASSVENGCRNRYGAWWLLLSDRDRQQIVHAIVCSMPDLVRYCAHGRGSSRAWFAADDFVEAIVCAPRMTGLADDNN